jgi:hypothetical protein
LSGANLFLVDSVASDPQFDHPVEVPDGFPGYVLPVPHPAGGQLYLKLRDDPSVVNQVTLAAENLPPPPGQAAHHATRAAYHEGEAAPAPGATGQTGSSEKPSVQPGNASANETKPGSQPSTPQQPTQPSTQPQSGTGQAPQGQSAAGPAVQSARQAQGGAAASPQQP